MPLAALIASLVPRLDFKVGKEKTGPDESVAHDLTVKLQLTLEKT